MPIQRLAIVLIVLAVAIAAVPVAAKPASAPRASVQADAITDGNVDAVRRVGGSVSQLHVVDTRAYLIGGNELITVDISNPAQPAILSRRSLPHSYTGFFFAGSLLYATGMPVGLSIFDLQNQAALVELGRAPAFDPAMDPNVSWHAALIQVQGNYAYVRMRASDESAETMRIIDVSNPAAPVDVSTFDLALGTAHFTVAGSYLYLGAEGSNPGIQVVNVSNPAAPVAVGGYPLSGAVDFVSLQMVGARLYADYYNGNERLLILDASNPAQLQKLAVYPGESAEAKSPRLFGVEGTIAYFGLDDMQWSLGVQAVNLANPSAPVAIGSLNLGPSNFTLGRVHGQYAYLVGQPPFGAPNAGQISLHTVSLANPAAPQLSASLLVSPFTEVGVVAASANALYIAPYPRFQRLSLADPLNPLLEAGRELDFLPGSLVIADGYAYLGAVFDSRVVVIDLSNPALPIVGTYQQAAAGFNSELKVLAVEGRRAYVQDPERNLLVVDFTTLNAPKKFAVGTISGGLAVAGGIAWFVESDASGAEVCSVKGLDLRNPAAPQQVASVRIDISLCTYHAPMLSIDNDGLYVGINGVEGSFLMNVFDISDPAQPTLQVSRQLDMWIRDLRVENATVYLNGIWSLLLFDHSRPTKLAQVGSIGVMPSPNLWAGMAVRNGVIYRSGDGLSILRSRTLAAGGAISQPNGLPFGGATIAASTGASQPTDAGGRFRFQDLPRGPLTFTPGRPGYVFWPPARSLDLPSNSPLLFQVTAPPVAASLPAGTQRSLAFTDTQGLPTSFVLDTTALSLTSSVAITPTPGPATLFGHAFAGHAFELAVDPAVAVTATIRYSAADLRVASDPAALALWRWTGAAWEPACAAPAHDPAARTFTVALCQPGAYALFAPTHQVIMTFIPAN